MTWQTAISTTGTPTIADAEACIIPHGTNVLLSTATNMPHGTPVQWKGNLYSNITISSNQITLPAGYFYYLEASAQGYYTGSDPGSTGYLRYAWYDNTGTTQLGSEGRVGRQYNGQDIALVTADEKSIALIDATSASVTVELKITAYNIFDYANYPTSQGIYSNMGRTLIMQLDP